MEQTPQIIDDNGLSLIKSNTDTKCAPALTFKDGSCIPLDILIKIAKEYNEMNDDKINLDKSMEVLHPKRYKRYLVSMFNEKLPKCNNQLCWLDQISDIEAKYGNKLANRIFRPIGPQGKFDWLNTININQVMDQYSDKYNDFLFLGAVPMDFYEINLNKIKELNYNDLVRDGIKKIGIIFNLDNHNQPGSHWVAGLVNFDNGHIYYYDSYGTRPGKRVREFYYIISKFIERDLKIKPMIDYNKKRHQYKDSECGMFSLYFIIQILGGRSFKEICNSKINDDSVNALRNKLFIIEEEKTNKTNKTRLN